MKIKGKQIFLLVFISFSKIVLAQKPLNFDFQYRGINSPFHTVKIINNRAEGSYNGFVQKGLGNRKEFVTFAGNFNDSFGIIF